MATMRCVAMVQDQRTGRACGLCNTLGLLGPKPGAAMWSQLCAKGVPDNARRVNWSLDSLETRSGESKQSPKGGDEVQTSEGRSGTREMTEMGRRWVGGVQRVRELCAKVKGWDGKAKRRGS